ncbi:hypothetical protein [Alkaliphilus serpentinus]|uniref:Uncharacterized protein n=1 Tax=Alkaliphilus serpentinus TaxID=1482731 RepID=A0A833HR12_9FIRM|nr:hypothetical protein [Alkaliphilus serpentinus]KAB3532734.1 hypothetical protein F8153_02120 [Alkaliphilus serpentinus]
MVEFRTKEEIQNLYVRRYDQLDVFALEELGREYDHFMKDLKNCKSREEVMEFFENKIHINEQRFRKSSNIGSVESSPCKDFYTLLASYGMIVFFRDHIIKE